MEEQKSQKFSSRDAAKGTFSTPDLGGAEKVAKSARPHSEPFAITVLPNGLPVEFHRNLSPNVAEIAVCSTDETKNKGPLNIAVFESLGVPIERLQEFEPPWTLLNVEKGTRPLVIRTVGADSTWSLTSRALREAFQPLVQPDGIQTIWIASLGAGAGRLSVEDSLRVCLHTLGSLNGVGRFRVLFSIADEQTLPDDVELTGWTQTEAPLHLDPGQLEDHVALALALARRRVGRKPVNARHIVEVVLDLASSDRSRAFQTLSNFLAFPARPVSEDELKKAQEENANGRFTVSPHVALAFLGVPDYVREKGERVWGRDLIATLLLSRDPSLEDLAKETGTGTGSLRDRWLAYVISDTQTPRPKEQWLAWWQDAGFQIDNLVQRSGYLPELVHTEDKLHIESEAHAFAGLICDESVAPPLSIALLGDWGSGKSFFMNKIKKKVAANNGTPGFCENAISIDFNAWHMSDANLWASLVDHIFQELRNAMFPEESSGDTFARELAKARGVVHAAQEDLADAGNDVETARSELETATAEVGRFAVRKQVKSAASALGLQDVYESVLDLERASKELSDASHQSRRILSAALQPASLHRGLWWVGASVVLGGLVVTIGAWPPVDDFANEVVGEALQTLGTLGGIVGSVIGSVTGAIRKGSSLVNDFNNEVQKGMKEYRDRLKNPKNAESEARVRYDKALDGLRVAREQLHRLEEGRGKHDPAKVLRRFIVERAQSEDYRARQGLISLVRRDFEKLAGMMNELREYRKNPDARRHANDAAGPKAQEADSSSDWLDQGTLVDRVVLYIDDLDRCKPKRVVEVLEAIHLLLGLDLFVVVVSVDSRWMLRALEVHYSELLTANGEMNGRGFRQSTPQNYLEKIFQIPFALAPMSERGFKNYIQVLVKDGAERVRDIEPGSDAQPKAATTSDEQPKDDAERQALAVRESGDKAKQTGAAETPPATWGQDNPDDALPHIVVITRAERNVMEQLGVLLPTPRQAKRLVNIFRLMKSQIEDGQLAAFEASDRGGHRDALVLLAILFGYPHLAHSLFRSIYELDKVLDSQMLCTYIDDWADKLNVADGDQPALTQGGHRADQSELFGATNESEALAEEAKQVSSILKERYADLKLAGCTRWVGAVSRYSLVTGQEWHTWKPGLVVQAQMKV